MVCRSVCDLWYEAFRRMCVRWLSAYGSCDLRLTAARYRPVIFLRSDADTCRDRRPDCPPQTHQERHPARHSYPPSDARTLSAVFSTKSHLPPATRRSEPSQAPKRPAGSSPRASQIIYHCRCIYNYKCNANISHYYKRNINRARRTAGFSASADTIPLSGSACAVRRRLRDRSLCRRRRLLRRRRPSRIPRPVRRFRRPRRPC